jgi:membrane fusion protein, multidrug efflux system
MSKPTSRAGVVVLAIIVLGAVVWWASHRRGAGSPDDGQAVPVVTSVARQGSFAVSRSQPGTVTPANSVLVRSRVDGELTRVNFTGGQQVKQGELLAEVDPRSFQAQLQLANGDLARSQSQLANAQETLKHYQALLTQDSISRQRVADQQALVNQYAAEVKSEQGRIGSANLQLSSTRITSPISGTVGLRRVDPGNLVGPADARGIVVVTQSQPSKVQFAVSVQDAPHVLERLRGGACIPVTAYGDDPSQPLATGRLLAANNEVDPATGTVKLEAQFANANNELLPNQFVTAKLPVDVLASATLVPTAAIQQGAQGAFVYVIKSDKTADAVPVVLGPADATTTVIRSGLSAGAQVVVEGADRLRVGTLVTTTSAPETPAATPAAPVACPAEVAPAATSSVRP